MNYTFSYYTKERVPFLEGKYWWQFWVKQKIGWREEWVRKVITGLSGREATLLMVTPANLAVVDLVKRMTGESKNWQLEHSTHPTVYYKTELEVKDE